MKVTPLFPYHPGFKWLGLGIILFSLFGLVWQFIQHKILSAEIPLMLISLGLVFIFFSREKTDDERIHQFKYQSLSWGILTAFFVIAGLNFLDHTFSAGGYLVMVLSMATAMFYFMKYNR